MSVKIDIANGLKDPISSECRAAQDLKLMLEQSFNQEVNGHISIASGITLQGQKTREIDLLMWGKLDNYVIRNYYTDDVNSLKKDLQVDSFCIVIELKEHPIEAFEIKNSSVFVRYNSQLQNATEQNENQKYALISYLDNSIHNKPYVANLIWLKNIFADQLKSLGKSNIVAVLPNTFSFSHVVEQLILQGPKPFYVSEEDRYRMSVGKNSDMLIKEISDCLLSLI